jgi:hypothetical protein
MAHTTLVLGAGLGTEYGFPDGPQLLTLLKEELEDNETELKDILDWSAGETVDSIATRRPDFADRLRCLVAKILFSKEDESKLKSTGKPSTYKVMIDQIASAQAQGDTVDIITFNYDRSLPYLIHRMNKVEIIKERQIQPDIVNHVYGRIAPLGFELPTQRNFNFLNYGGKEYSLKASVTYGADNGYDPYDDLNERSRIIRNQEAMQKQNQIHHEERIFQSESKVAFIGEVLKNPSGKVKKILEKSDQIFFLGLRYHEANMEILGFDFTKNYPHKMIAGTVYGMEKDDVLGLNEKYPSIDYLESCDALTFLKYKFSITDFSRNLKKKEISTPRFIQL